MMAVSFIQIESKKMQQIDSTDTARSAFVYKKVDFDQKIIDGDAEKLPVPTTSDLSGAQCANRAS